MSEAATVTAVGSLAGEKLHALAAELAAATATSTPELDRLATALLRAALLPPPSDRLATDGPGELAVTKSTPSITAAVVPKPEQSRTRTPRSCTFLATP